MTAHAELLRNAARNLLHHSLRLYNHSTLLIIADSTALPVADLLLAESKRCDIQAACFYVPTSYQAAFTAADTLPTLYSDAINAADGVVSCLNDGPDCLAFRSAILKTSTMRFIRTIHSPGLTLEILKATAVDYVLIQEHCRKLALPLALGRQLEIFSIDHLGRKHRLVVALPGWELPPGISDGTVGKGNWANLPPGETFVLPTNGDGAIAINGSLPGMVLSGNDSVVLHFESGRLVGWEPEEGAATHHLLNGQLAVARANGDPHWSTLAEIGFGANPLIRTLLGVEVHDEKQVNTIHIALGSNDRLGGTIHASIHCDLVVTGPTVLIDRKPVLVDGEFCLNLAEWLEEKQDPVQIEQWWNRISGLHRTVSRAETVDGQLYRVWSLMNGRYGRLQVGSSSLSATTARIYECLPENATVLTCAELLERASAANIESATVPACVRLLLRYDLVQVKGA